MKALKTGHSPWVVLVVLLLWMQLSWGLGMTFWRYDLILWGGWQVYPSGVPKEYDAFIAFAQQVTPPNANLVYLAPTGDMYTARFARLHYFLYPRELLWLGTGPPTLLRGRWTPTDLSRVDLQHAFASGASSAVIVDSVAEPLPVPGKRLDFDSTHYILTLTH